MGRTASGIVARFPMYIREFHFVHDAHTNFGTHLPSYSVGAVTLTAY